MANLFWLQIFVFLIYLTDLGHLTTIPRIDPMSQQSTLFSMNDFFSYETASNLGPKQWHKYWPQCGGKQQSPIDIKTCQVTYGRPYRIFYSDLNRVDGLLVNNAHSVVFYVNPRSKTLTGIPHTKKTDVFALYSFNFHFGQDLETGSEHCVDSVTYPVEIQMMHINTKYPDMNAAISQPDGRVILSVFMEVDPSSLSEIDRFILEFVSQVIKPNATGVAANINLSALLPFDGNFFTYMGSMTTPPCDEGIRWINMRQPIKISPLSLLTLYQLKDNHNIRASKFGNHRPPQEGNCRLVEANF